jgi:penicillin-binding protein 1C
MTPLRRALTAAAALAGTLAAAALALDAWVATTVLPDLAPRSSVTVLDRNGTLLRAYTTPDGRWRLPVAAADVDPGYRAMLVALEDKRFAVHPGIDPLALVRAAAQAVANRRVVSGGSTLTMQAARLLEDGPTGDLAGKIRQIRVALALERRLDKDAILALYLARAPFGGNLEGVRAASLAWFGKEPRRLTPAESALLVVLPQSPEARRPDRHPTAARAARDRALARAVRAGVLAPADAEAARREPVPTTRRPFPALAPHLANRLVAAAPEAPARRTTLDAGLQRRLETLVAARVRDLGPGLSAAIVVADHRTGAIRAHVGSSGLTDTARGGFLDMTRALRSPGSTLKPLIYGLAFEAGLAHPDGLIDDRPMRFGAYAPQNLDHRFVGTMTLRAALQQSRNLPAVALLDAVGPARLMARLRRAGIAPALPPGSTPGLAVALGGVGLTLEDLVTLYAGIAGGGEAVRLTADPEAAPETRPRLLAANAAWQVADVLKGVAPPSNGVPDRIAYKTGTSYGHRDAWAIGFDGAHTIGVWIGRPDAAAVPGVLGIDVAAPLLFDAFARVSPAPAPLPLPPASVLTVSAGVALPPPLRRFVPRGTPLVPGPAIAYPPDGARVDLGIAAGAPAPLVVRVGAGTPPFRWLVDGAPLAAPPFAREALWQPDGAGYVSVAVIDATGASARTSVFVE